MSSKRPIAKFGPDFHPTHPSLQFNNGAYFKTIGDTIYPSSYIKFYYDGTALASQSSRGIYGGKTYIYIFNVTDDTIHVQDIYGWRNIFGWTCWMHHLQTFIVESDSSIIYTRTRIDFHGGPGYLKDTTRYVFKEMDRPIYDRISYEDDIRHNKFMWKNKAEWKEWKTANGRK